MIEEDERRKQQEKIEATKKRNIRENELAREAINAANPNAVQVRYLLRYVAKICGFFKSSIVVNPTTGEVAAMSTAVNEGRRSVYCDLRRMMTEDTRKQVEAKEEEIHG